MHCKILKKYWYKIPFPDNITLIDAVKVIQKYIKMENILLLAKPLKNLCPPEAIAVLIAKNL